MTSEGVEMRSLARADLLSLEAYEEVRDEFRSKVMEHKKSRRVLLGEHLTLHFEDRLTIQYQVQEMLRTEKIFQAEGIEEELAAYNPLIPSGHNWKATMMIEYEDVAMRRAQLGKLIGIDRLVWVKVEGGGAKTFAVSNEDLERETEDKTAAVHFLRFELDAASLAAALSGAAVSVGCDHENYNYSVVLSEAVCEALVSDLSIG